ncbi:MAG: FtsW/RodA/SpoVE family cell cycle protein [Candidatus Levybacteria bacterium]|nr:FtsW/RodA/SpoVE family cell cycle protein [Candidatus Levybacteria bacterium]
MRFPKLPNFSIDWLLMIPVFVLIIISLVTLFSIDQEYFKNQLVYFIISLSVFVFFSQINPSILKRYSVPIYVSSLILLIFLLIIGVESRGSVRWITFFGFGIQFSELLKPFLAISLASYLSNIRLYSFKNFILTLALVFPLSLLIFMQPDLGNALVYLGVMLFVLLISGFPYKFFASSFLLFLASFPLFWLFLHDY